MIDFENAAFLKLKPEKSEEAPGVLEFVLLPGEDVHYIFRSGRDYVIFTKKRILVINTQGITGKKQDITSLPYNRIQSYSMETSGTLDWDCELDLWYSGVGKIRFEFNRKVDITEIYRLISQKLLG